jgi:hypothetical protein
MDEIIHRQIEELNKSEDLVLAKKEHAAAFWKEHDTKRREL